MVSSAGMNGVTPPSMGAWVMLAIPPSLLDVLNIRAGARFDIAIEDSSWIAGPTRRPECFLEPLRALYDETVPSHARSTIGWTWGSTGREQLMGRMER